MSDARKTQVLVVGGGPGGYTAAFRAADLGLSVTLVNTGDKPGGVCLHTGCIPSKTLLYVSNLIHEAGHARDFGVDFGKPAVDLDRLRAFKESVTSRMANGLVDLCRLRKIEYIRGHAVFEGPGRVRVDGREPGNIEYEMAVLAPGSRTLRLPAMDIASSRVVHSGAALMLKEIPGTMLVVGGGYIGLELGLVFAGLGSRVTLVEHSEALLNHVDKDLVRPLAARCEKIFEAVLTRTRLTGLKDAGVSVEAAMEGGGREVRKTFDQVLVAVGRAPNSDAMGLETTGVKLDARGFVKVDSRQRTDDPKIWAAGDVCGGPMLAHKAMAEGKAAAEAMAGAPQAVPARTIPAALYTDPEIAWCGMLEADAERQGVVVEAARFPWTASGRSLGRGRDEGLTKLIFEPATGRILGGGIVGPNAGEFIAEVALAVEMNATARDIARTVHPYPTLSETVAWAAEVFLGTATEAMGKMKS
jgi:dihydrolipoamide dehydrogenase